MSNVGYAPHVRGRECCCSMFMTDRADLHASYWFNHTGQPSCTQTAAAQSPSPRLCALPAHETSFQSEALRFIKVSPLAPPLRTQLSTRRDFCFFTSSIDLLSSLGG